MSRQFLITTLAIVGALLGYLASFYFMPVDRVYDFVWQPKLIFSFKETGFFAAGGIMLGTGVGALLGWLITARADKP